MGYRLTRRAAEDIEGIYLTGVERFGIRQADDYHQLLEKTFRFLAENPLVARQRPELIPAVRVHPVQSHLVIYRVMASQDILVIRVRHAHEDWADNPG